MAVSPDFIANIFIGLICVIGSGFAWFTLSRFDSLGEADQKMHEAHTKHLSDFAMYRENIARSYPTRAEIADHHKEITAQLKVIVASQNHILQVLGTKEDRRSHVR